jgi:branched-subunit amino acid permease
MAHPLIRSVGIGLLAGISGAAFGGLAAAVLGLSTFIAALASGVSLAAIVTYFVYRYPPNPTAPED